METQFEAPANMEMKARRLMDRINIVVTPFYERATEKQREGLHVILDELDQAIFEYRKYERQWDSTLIDTVGQIDGTKFKTKTISTFDSVMDKAREVFAFICSPESCDGC